MSLFRTQRNQRSIPSSPSQLFHNLRRSDDIKFLWAHQERLLDDYYQNFLDEPNVALELPTGSGKTLVGLLIAEFRRQARCERAVYLCPTRQLCSQVKQHADRYGIACSLLIGPKGQYDTQQFMNYQRGSAIAITTYSGIFNSHPAIDDPQVIICDDAHAGESFIAALWSLDIDRAGMPNLYQALIDFFGDAIPDHMRRRIRRPVGDPYEKDHVEIVPSPAYSGRIDDLADLLDEHCRNSDLRYPWSMLHGHLEACTIYASPNSILIRPVIPPPRRTRRSRAPPSACSCQRHSAKVET